MKFTLTALTCLAPMFAVSAAHAEGPRCDNARLMKTLSLQLGGETLSVKSSVNDAGDDAVAVVERKAGSEVLRVTCDEVSVPMARNVDKPRRGPAATLTSGPVTVSVTARGAVSVDIAAGALHAETIQLLLLDDQSVSLTRGKDTLYAFATRPDGSTVETEGRGVGCGCVKTTVDGKTTTRAL